jgi:hypothetical protein
MRKAGKLPPYKPPGRTIIHGTEGGYVNGCRCEECRVASAAARRARRLAVTAGERAVEKHNANGYSNGCRCDECRAGNTEKARLWRASRPPDGAVERA